MLLWGPIRDSRIKRTVLFEVVKQCVSLFKMASFSLSVYACVYVSEHECECVTITRGCINATDYTTT